MTEHFDILYWSVFALWVVLYLAKEMCMPWNNGTDWSAKNAEIDAEISEAIAERRKDGA